MKFNIIERVIHPTFFMAIGLSGIGKSTYLNKVFEREVLVEPDAIRREMTGNVSNQNQDFKVWGEVTSRVIKKLETIGWAVLDATSTKSSLRTQFLKNISEGVRKVAIVFQPEGTDEEIVDKLYKRIQKDLKKGKDRSNVPKEVIARQLKQFKNGIINLNSQFDEVQIIPVNLEDETNDWFNMTSYA